MSSKKISQLPQTPTSSGSDLFPLVQLSNNYAITFANLQSAIASAFVPAQLPAITLIGEVMGSGSGGTITTTLIPGTVTQDGSLTAMNNRVFSNTAPMGLLTGTTIVNIGGFTIRNLAGIGYVQESFSGNVQLVPWGNVDLTLPANSNLYVYYNPAGDFVYSPTMPDTVANVVMGRVVTNATGIELIEESGFNALHSANAIGNMLRLGLGPVYVNGSQTAELGTRTLQVSPGSYFFGERQYQLVGGSPILFDLFYQDGAGGTTIVPGQVTIDNAHWDNGTGTLANLGAGNYAKHSLYALGEASPGSGNEKYFVVYSQVQYTSLTLAEQGELPSPPAFIIGGAEALIAAIIVQQGVPNITEIMDERPFIGATRTANIAATTYHHGLLGLNDFDDHLRYLPVNGTRPMLANLDMGTFNVIDAGTYNGVVVENHHARHQPGSGLDELPTAIAVDVGTANAVGTSTSLSRADHVHLGVRSVQSNGGTQRFGNLNLKSGVSVSVTDNGDNSFTFDTVSAENELLVTAGSGLTALYTGGIVWFNGTETTISSGSLVLTASQTNWFIYVDVDAVVKNAAAVPSNAIPLAKFSTSGAAITSLADAREKMDHNLVFGSSGDIVTILPDATTVAGATNRYADAGHTHAVATAAAVSQTPNLANAKGTSTSFARADHIHNIPTGIASALNANSTNTQGTTSAFAQQDHTHAIASGTPSSQTPDQANATGTSTNFARADHIHDIPTGVASALTPNAGNSQGTASAFARQDHIHNVPTAAPANQTIAAAVSDGSASTFSRSDHLHTFTTAVPTDVGAANSAGTSTSFVHADHIHKGLHSINANSGTQRFGDVSLQSGVGITVTDDGSGNFTFNTSTGDDEFVITSTSGLQINYTGGRFVNGVNGSVVNVPSGNVTVTANTALGYLYVAVNNLNNASATVVASTTPPGIGYLPFAQYVSGPSTITSTTDERSFVNTAPLIHSLRVYYTGSGLVVNYNSSDVRINGVFTTINAGSITLSNAIALGAIYVDATTSTVTVNTTGTFPPNCTPLATYTTSGGNVTALNLVRVYLNNNIVFGLSSDIANLTPNLAAAAGSTNKYADAGHIHDVPTAAPANQTIAAAAADGTAATFSRSDHLHTFTTAAAATQTPNQANAVGTSTSFARADHVHSIPTGVASALTPNAGNSQGTASAFAQQDHIHNVPTAAPANQTIAAAASDGSAATFSRADHLHTFTTAAPVSQTPNQANAVGTSTSFTRADHVHNIPTAAPSTLNATNANTQGTAASFAQSDHLHAITTGAASTQTPDQANGTGVSSSLARADHVHNIPTAAASVISTNTNTQGVATTFARADHAHQLTAGTALLDHLPQYDGSNWQTVYPEAALNLARAWAKNDDFLSNSGASTTIIGDLSWTVTNSGAGSTVATNIAQLDSGHPGIVRLTAGGGGGNSAGIILNSTNIIILGGGTLTAEWLIQVPTLATVANDYSFRCGIGDSATADFTNGVYFEYTRGTSTNWLLKTANGGTRTTSTSTSTVTAGSWVKLTIVVNAAANSVSYFINGTLAGVSTGTNPITTNIPAAGTSFAANHTRTAGTPPGVDIDYFTVNQRFTTSR